MIYLVLFSILLVAAYTLAVCIKGKGVPQSLSATFYALGRPWWFTLAMWGTAFAAVPVMIEVSAEDVQFAAFWACAGMVLVGAAPHFREEFEKNLHLSGAVLCIVFSQLWVALACPWCLTVWAAYLIYTAIGMKRWWNGNFKQSFLLTKPMFWVEICALAAVYATLFVKL